MRAGGDDGVAPAGPGDDGEPPDVGDGFAGRPGAGLAESAAGGVKWSLVSNLTRQGGRVAFTLVLARLVGPESFGIVSQATVYIAFTQLLLDQGFGAALIQRQKLEGRDIGSVFWLNLASVAVMVAVTIAAAPFVAAYFRTPELTTVLRVLSISVVVKGLQVVPMAMLSRTLRFRELSMVEVVGVLGGGAVGIAGALSGMDYWALVLQTVAIDVIIITGLFLVVGLPPLSFSFTRLRSMLRFSSNVMATNFLLFAGRNVDNALIGRYLGPSELAFYAISYRFLTLPVQMLGQTVGRVAFPVFTRLHDRPDRLRRWYLTVSVSMGGVAFPVLTLMILGAPDGIPLLFGDVWEPAVLPLQILTFVAFRQITLKLAGPLFMALGRADVQFQLALATTVVVTIGFVVGLSWGIVGVAAGYAVANYAMALPTMWIAHRLIGLPSGEYFRAMLPPQAACVAMAAAWFAVDALVSASGLSIDVVRLTIDSLAAVAAYLAVYRFAWPGNFAQSRAVALQIVRGSKREPAAA